MKKTWKFLYWFPYSEWFEWETEITDEEEAIINAAIAADKELHHMDELMDLYDRVRTEIEESYAEETDEDDDWFDDDEEYDEERDPCEDMRLRIYDPNDPFYSVD